MLFPEMQIKASCTVPRDNLDKIALAKQEQL